MNVLHNTSEFSFFIACEVWLYKALKTWRVLHGWTTEIYDVLNKTP